MSLALRATEFGSYSQCQLLVQHVSWRILKALAESRRLKTGCVDLAQQKVGTTIHKKGAEEPSTNPDWKRKPSMLKLRVAAPKKNPMIGRLQRRSISRQRINARKAYR